MSGLVGKGVRSYKKAIVSDSNFPALGFINFIMAFENASDQAGPFSVSLIGTLTVPPEMVTAGFQQPDGITIGNAQLGNFRNNVVVTSNLNGVLLDRISYTLTNDSITFDDGLNAGEIIVIKRGNEAVTGNRIVDARPLRASGTVDFSTIGSAPVIFQVGEGFRIAPSTTATGGIDNRQIGFVQVFVDGVLQSRNVGNEDESSTAASEQTGNYREVIVNTATNLPLAVQNGVTANAIQFNQFQPFSSEEGVIVISTNLIVDSPNSTGVLDQIDVVQAQVTSNDVDIAANTAAIAGIGGGAIIEIQEFEVTGMWTAPADCVAALIQGAGGGGSGGAGNSISGSSVFGRATGGTGGGAGEYREDIVNITGGEVYDVTVGTGGPQTASSGAGITGNASTVVGTGVNISFAPGAGGNRGHTISSTNGTTSGGEINTSLNTTFPIGTANFRGGLGGASPKGDGERAIGMFATTTGARESQFAIDATAPIGDTTFLIRSGGGLYRFGPGSRGGYNEKAIGGLGDEGRFDTGGVTSTAGGAAGGGGGWIDGSVGTASNPNPANNGSTATFGGAGGRGGVRIFAYSITPIITT